AQHRAQRAFERQAVDGARDVWRLIKLVTDLYVVGQDALEFRQVLFDEIDDRQRRGVGSLGDGDIDGAAAVHERVTSDDVGGVLHIGHVADEHGGKNPGLNRDDIEVLDVLDHRIERHHRI